MEAPARLKRKKAVISSDLGVVLNRIMDEAENRDNTGIVLQFET